MQDIAVVHLGGTIAILKIIENDTSSATKQEKITTACERYMENLYMERDDPNLDLSYPTSNLNPLWVTISMQKH